MLLNIVISCDHADALSTLGIIGAPFDTAVSYRPGKWSIARRTECSPNCRGTLNTSISDHPFNRRTLWAPSHPCSFRSSDSISRNFLRRCMRHAGVPHTAPKKSRLVSSAKRRSWQANPSRLVSFGISAKRCTLPRKSRIWGPQLGTSARGFIFGAKLEQAILILKISKPHFFTVLP